MLTPDRGKTVGSAVQILSEKLAVFTMLLESLIQDFSFLDDFTSNGVCDKAVHLVMGTIRVISQSHLMYRAAEHLHIMPTLASLCVQIVPTWICHIHAQSSLSRVLHTP